MTHTKFYFFSGKGGVGKTTMASSTAVFFAGLGKRTLIITTDPASNLADVFDQEIGHKITPIAGQPNLFAMELNPDEATREYKERTMAPLRALLPQESLAVIEEQLNSPCTAEMASFERFTDFLQVSDFEIIIFDTAPTGHTLRLIQLPVEWGEVIEKASHDPNGGQTCIGPAAALAESKVKFDEAVKVMRDSNRTTFVFVLRPETTSIFETKRSVDELAKLEISNFELIVNGLYPRVACDTNYMLAKYVKQQENLLKIQHDFNYPVKLIELNDTEIKGLELFAGIGKKLYESPLLLTNYSPEVLVVDSQTTQFGYPNATPRILERLLPKANMRKIVFFTGKGGVGKSTVASATAVWTAERGYKTLLLTTDPASHLANIFGLTVYDQPTQVENHPNLWLTKIDTARVTSSYKEKILSEARLKYDAQRIFAIEEELNSPCTEEMATFDKFIEFASLKEFDVIVFDTAPTGHTLRLLELPIEWSKQIEIKTFSSTGETEVDKQTKARFESVINMMKDQNQSTISFVMYPEKTPIEEASRAIEELHSLGINTSLIIANQILPDSTAQHGFFRNRKEMQTKYLAEINERFKLATATLPLLMIEPNGYESLKEAGYLLYGK